MCSDIFRVPISVSQFIPWSNNFIAQGTFSDPRRLYSFRVVELQTWISAEVTCSGIGRRELVDQSPNGSRMFYCGVGKLRKSGKKPACVNKELLPKLNYEEEVHRRWRRGWATCEEYQDSRQIPWENQSSAGVENCKGYKEEGLLVSMLAAKESLECGPAAQ